MITKKDDQVWSSGPEKIENDFPYSLFGDSQFNTQYNDTRSKETWLIKQLQFLWPIYTNRLWNWWLTLQNRVKDRVRSTTSDRNRSKRISFRPKEISFLFFNWNRDARVLKLGFPGTALTPNKQWTLLIFICLSISGVCRIGRAPSLTKKLDLL